MFDAEKFICEIEQRPAIYDVTSKEYSNKKIKAECWSSVGEAMYKDWHFMASKEKDQKCRELMNKWKALRDNFVRELRFLKRKETVIVTAKKKKYIYFDQLSFLAPYVKGNDSTVSNIPPPVEDDCNLSEQPETDHSAPKRKIPLRKEEVTARRGTGKLYAETSKILTDVFTESVLLQRSDRNYDKYGNKCFMLSFVPMMDTLPEHLQFQTRMKIAEIFNDIACSMSSPNPSPCASASTYSTPTPAKPKNTPT